MFSQVWTVKVSKHHQTVQDQRKSDMIGLRTLYDFVHHLRQGTADQEESRNIKVAPPNFDVLGPEWLIWLYFAR